MLLFTCIRMKRGGARTQTHKKKAPNRKGIISTMRKKKTASKNNLRKIIQNIERKEENPFEYLANASDFLERIGSKASNILDEDNSRRSHKMYDKVSIIASTVAQQIADTLQKDSSILQTKVKAFNEMNIESNTKDSIREIYEELINEDLATVNPFEYIEGLKEKLDEIIELHSTAVKEGDSDLEINLTIFAVFLQEELKEAIQNAKSILSSVSKSKSTNNMNINTESVTSKSSRGSSKSKPSEPSVDELANLFSSSFSLSFGKGK